MILHNRILRYEIFSGLPPQYTSSVLEGWHIRAVPGITYSLNQVRRIAIGSTKGNVLRYGVRLENSLVTEG
jgi:hypothetical protein